MVVSAIMIGANMAIVYIAFRAVRRRGGGEEQGGEDAEPAQADMSTGERDDTSGQDTDDNKMAPSPGSGGGGRDGDGSGGGGGNAERKGRGSGMIV